MDWPKVFGAHALQVKAPLTSSTAVHMKLHRDAVVARMIRVFCLTVFIPAARVFARGRNG